MTHEEQMKLLENYPKNLKKLLAPCGAIKSLEVSGNNLIISMDQEIPESFQITEKGTEIELLVHELLLAQEAKTRAEERQRASEVIRIHEQDCEMAHIGVCLDEMKEQILSDNNNQNE